ncbi:MAG: ATP-binding cassette domain-containing protein [Clostridium sp.]|nr:ATP-binding cassette domain-containing protein [Clostridium sp.]
MLEISGIYKSYRRQEILRGVTLAVKPGECVGIVGYNGCGKTTLLSILAGAQKADKGSIRYNGREALGRSEVFAEEAAYVPQENPLMEELTVRDNLLLWYRGGREAMKKDLETGAAAMLGVDRMLKQTAGRLSGGMKKRVSIACALSNHAPVLIMDEPGAALDLECKEVIKGYLRNYMAEGGAVILTSHELSELSLCTSVYVLKEGKLIPIANDLSAEELIHQFR